jgi:hypothetical protein
MYIINTSFICLNKIFKNFIYEDVFIEFTKTNHSKYIGKAFDK